MGNHSWLSVQTVRKKTTLSVLLLELVAGVGGMSITAKGCIQISVKNALLNVRRKKMPWNDPEIQKVMLNHIVKNYKPATIAILDVGPGIGTFGKHLHPHFYIDCIEIFELYLYKYKLYEKYNNIMWGNIKDFTKYERYNLVIVGDVFEHMTEEDARTALDNMKKGVDEIVISLPYESQQGEECGNPYEIHIQDYLTPEIISELYPELTQIYENKAIGRKGLAVYNWKKEVECKEKE